MYLPSLARPTDWRYTASVVSGGHFLSHFYFLVLPPLFPALQRTFELSNAELGIVVSVMSAFSLLQILVGGVVDRSGAKWVLVAGIALTSVGIALVGLAPNYPLLLVFVTLSGIGQATFHPADYAIIESVTDSKSVGKGFSLHTFSGYAGFAAAPIAINELRQMFGWRLALIGVGIVGMLYGLATVFLLDTVYVETAQGGDEADDANTSGLRLFQPTILALFGFFIVLTLAGKGVQTFTTILAVENFELPESAGNLALTAYFTLAALGIFVGGFLADRFQPRRVLGSALGVATMVTWFIVSGQFPVGTTTVAGSFGVLGFFVGLVFPSRDRIVSEAAPAGSTGKSFGFVFTGITVGGIIGPVLLGSVIDLTSTSIAFFLVGFFYLGAAIIAFLSQ